jgi:hypothetical protein
MLNSDWLLQPTPYPAPSGFFAYASSPPSIPETIKAAIQGIDRSQAATVVSWEELEVGGKFVIGEICAAIDRAQFFCADITTINANVMFELGYAIAQNKRIWLVRDDSYTDSRKEFEQLKVLTTVGYSPYVNSAEIIKGFFSESPHKTTEETIFRLSIEPSLGPTSVESESLLYLKSRFDTEASVRISRVLQDSEVPLTVDDPRETSVRPLTWYGQKLYGAIGFAAHFLSPAREGFRLHNARYALVSGLARGFKIPSLMLTEQHDLLAPIDYRDAMRLYATPAEAARLTNEWLDCVPALRSRGRLKPKTAYANVVRLATELKDFHLQLGEYVAENEAEHLGAYFVETTAYTDVVNGTHTIFVGRKGTGKTANLIRAAEQIGGDIQNLVVIIKPPGYEIEALARLFASYSQQDQKGYVIESLWKFMLYSEVAHALARQMHEVALWQLAESTAQELVALIEDPNGPFLGDFTVRLERAVHALSKLTGENAVEVFRRGVSEALHAGSLSRLRLKLTEVLARKHLVLLLIDNLDKPWTKSADLEQLGDFLLGLLGAASRVAEEFRQGVKQKRSVRFNSAVFLRSDIFNRLVAVAREPDKLSFTRLKWDDPEFLLRVVEERFVASHGTASDPAEMWHRYFDPQTHGIPTREYLTSRILPRPRDIIFFVKAAVSFAVNRKHERVEERDILDGEKQYSQYALDSILVENGISIPELEAVLLEFVASPAILSETLARQNVSRAGVEAEEVDAVLARLVDLTFLGLEVSPDRFAFSDEPKEVKKYRVLAEHYRRDRVILEQRYQINPAFRAYLEVLES